MLHAFERACGRELPYKVAPRRPGDIAECYADAEKARRVLGWSAKLGIDDMCKSSWNWQSKIRTVTQMMRNKRLLALIIALILVFIWGNSMLSKKRFPGP